MSLTHVLDRELTVYRTTATANATGGLDETCAPVGQVWAMVPQPSSSTGPAAVERTLARTGVGPQQGVAEMALPVFVEPDEDVARSDYLHDPDTDQWWRVTARVVPSNPDVYLRLDCEIDQPEQVVA